jgi:hypothetical protein
MKLNLMPQFSFMKYNYISGPNLYEKAIIMTNQYGTADLNLPSFRLKQKKNNSMATVSNGSFM